ncbi:type 1 glutamine amidotransferase [Stratiformator vulcanicus]|uniref:GMP synthase [glutamine-hydrolyzing] n=1 Tax=Stratiformator vulcanicus TaxID=2527980 RepID=A0A517R2C5_9PLAN|nr:type 1 glutamine amidotransferase [Stratiformator vulcanicus]QDT38014.1 GMP synthase [glutamine-hydrolyzing] [Stratiformator vulcanicus]
MQRIHVLQHVPFEGPAAIADWALERGATVAVSHVYRGDPLPALDEFDMLVVMGGPMSVNDEAEHDWITPETTLIQAAIEADKIVFGVCLGAQFIAKALGASIYKASEKEIGWFAVRRVESTKPEAFAGFPETFTPLHWHGETFDLPDGAIRLAETDVCPNQAFQYGRRVIGLQFHLEATPGSVASLAENCGHEIGDGLFQQNVEQISDCHELCDNAGQILRSLLEYLRSA